MRLKPGYKQTEVGMIPEDWEVRRIIDCCDYADYRGKTPPKTSNGTFLVTAKNIKKGFIDYQESQEYVPTELYDQIMRRGRPRIGDILITTEAPLGNVAQVDREDIALAQRIIKYQPKTSNLLANYLKQYFLSERFQQILNDRSSGSTAKGIKGSILHLLPIVMPPLMEQRAIAVALSEMDELLGRLDLLIAKKRDLKLAVMQQLLTGKLRLPGFQGEWETVSLGELFSFKNGLNKGKEFFGIGTPIVNYMDVYQHCGLSANSLKGRVTVNKQELKAFNVKRGDVFFTRTSETVEEIGIAATMLDDCSETVFSGFLLRARPKDESLCNSFKKYIFSSTAVRKQIVSRSSYTTRALTNGRLLSAVILHRPPKEEQSAIAAVLSDMDAEIVALEQRRDKMRAIKQGMMQELLTGKTRLVEVSQVSRMPA